MSVPVKNALYFPYISVPSSVWTTQAILYWDKLASIVPMHILENPGLLDGTTQQLLTEGLIEPVIPGQFIGGKREFDDCFINWVEKRGWARPGERLGRSSPPVRIHAEKLGGIPDYLVERGLATRLKWPWYEMDVQLANAFMAYLAAVLGGEPEINATPITDRLSASVSLGNLPSARTRLEGIHHAKARATLLRSVLPVPAGPMDITKLVRFKEMHGHLLPALRAQVESHCSSIAVIPTSEQRALATDKFIRDCQDQINEILAAMRPTFSKVVLGSLTPLFGAGLALQSTDQGNSIAYAGAGLSLVGAAYQALAGIHGPRSAAEAKPLAYFAYAQRDFGEIKTGSLGFFKRKRDANI